MKDTLAELLRDCVAITGGATVLWSLWLIFPPLSLFTAGAMMVASAWWMATAAAAHSRKEDE